MEAKTFLSSMGYDDFDKVKEQIENREPFHIHASVTDAPNEIDEHVGIMICSSLSKKNDMIFTSIEPEDAIFFAKSIIALAEHIKGKE